MSLRIRAGAAEEDGGLEDARALDTGAGGLKLTPAADLRGKDSQVLRSEWKLEFRIGSAARGSDDSDASQAFPPVVSVQFLVFV